MTQVMPEIIWQTSRSSGAGGQHVNKVETRVTLQWDVVQSQILSDDEKRQVGDRLSTYINKAGVLSVHCEASRSQQRNKDQALNKLKKLLDHAFHKAKKRKPTRPTAASEQRRRKTKSNRSVVKALRSKPSINED
jgi:ribosome-associated protein